METRVCNSCHEEFPLTNEYFYKNNKTGKYLHYCKKCRIKKATEYRKNKEKKEDIKLGRDSILIGSTTGAVALIKAIFSEEFILPEQAIASVYKETYLFTDADTLDMIAMRKEGMSFREIGEIYNLGTSSIFRRIERYNKRKAKEVM